MKNLSQIVWGAILIAAGVLFALNLLGLTEVEVFFEGWWTLFIIVPCLVGMLTGKDKAGNFFGVLIGIFLLLCAREILDWRMMIPVLIVLLGIRLIVKATDSSKTPNRQIKGQQALSCSAVFSGQKMRCDGEPFYAANLLAVFGGVDCDLSDALIENDATVNAYAVFGGVDIKVPDGVKVKVTSFSLFGGVEDKRANVNDETAPTLYIQSLNLFGGTEVK